MRSSHRRRPFYGWYIVGSSSTAFLLAFGFIYSFSVFAKPISHMIGYDHEGVAALFSVSYTVFQLAGFVTGTIADKTGPRALVAIGGVFLGVGILIASRATNNLEIAAAYGMGVGVGLACIYVPATEVVGDWFIRGRGFATGLTVAGMGLGNLLIPPIAASMIIRYGIRSTLAGYGMIALIAIPAASILLVAKPEDLGQLPDGDTDPSEALAEEESGSSVREALHSRSFWMLYFSVFLASFGLFLPFAHLDNYATHHGASPEIAAVIVSMIGLGVVVSRVVLGRFFDRFAPRHLVTVAMGFLAASMLLWLGVGSPVLLGIFAVIFGICYAINNALQPALVLDYFGEKHGGALIGLLFSAAVPGGLFGPTVAGEILDRIGTLKPAIALGGIAFLLAMISLLFIPEPALAPHRAARKTDTLPLPPAS